MVKHRFPKPQFRVRILVGPQKSDILIYMKNKGFTLIELLVVISIISLLSSIVFASVSSARDKAQIVKAKTQAVEISKAIELSRLSSGSFNLPVQTTQSDIKSLSEETSNDSIYKMLEEYIPNLSGGNTDILNVPEIAVSTNPVTGERSSNNDHSGQGYYYISNGSEAIKGTKLDETQKFSCGYDDEFSIDDYVLVYKEFYCNYGDSPGCPHYDVHTMIDTSDSMLLMLGFYPDMRSYYYNSYGDLFTEIGRLFGDYPFQTGQFESVNFPGEWGNQYYLPYYEDNDRNIYIYRCVK